jgi:hypothetical protein
MYITYRALSSSYSSRYATGQRRRPNSGWLNPLSTLELASVSRILCPGSLGFELAYIAARALSLCASPERAEDIQVPRLIWEWSAYIYGQLYILLTALARGPNSSNQLRSLRSGGWKAIMALNVAMCCCRTSSSPLWCQHHAVRLGKQSSHHIWGRGWCAPWS